MSSSRDPMYRAGLHAAACTPCGRVIRHGEDRVNMRATWRTSPDVLCRDCWLTILTTAGAAIALMTLDQAELPFEAN